MNLNVSSTILSFAHFKVNPKSVYASGNQDRMSWIAKLSFDQSNGWNGVDQMIRSNESCRAAKHLRRKH
ncbi:hypothetical protein DAPPUDRAFT_319602 [Daphnia pulex]|uniref:Uncharacterized protein n=1 Tax=Daphnia pulex TaxID=6669 RepID=E9GM89_DAPPU|nr:hypothetical protein DAPPUDRAFT_319602 [Daphnia pulex]|eukprot:EFX79322.1 hypothetical protein DAPPUDRAFT_319602 [Daphnia pulex]